MLIAKNLKKSYLDRAKKRRVSVLDDVCLSVKENEIVGLMGQSGSGKSTLARILLRLVPCEAGEIFFGGLEISQLPERKLNFFRQKVQFISQRPETFFDPTKKLGYSLVEPSKIFKLDYGEDEISALLDSVELDAGVLRRYPFQVSGGEIQRLSIARALLLKPHLLILDEPTSMLDILVQAQVLHVLKDLQEKRGLSYLLISHDKEVVKFFCHRSLVLENGKIRDGVL